MAASHGCYLGIDLQARQELILAYLSKAVIRRSHWSWSDYDKAGRTGGGDEYLEPLHFSRLWKLVAKWPKEYKHTRTLQHHVYAHLGTDDETKAQVYRTCDVPWLRLVILESCDRNEPRPELGAWLRLGKADSNEWTKTIELGLRDSDRACREVAHSLVADLSEEELARLLSSHDTEALAALARNKRLSTVALQRLFARLKESPSDDSALILLEINSNLIRREDDPVAAAFLDLPRGRFVEEKIDVIGTTVRAMEAEIPEITERLWRLEAWAKRTNESVEWFSTWGLRLALALGALAVLRWLPPGGPSDWSLWAWLTWFGLVIAATVVLFWQRRRTPRKKGRESGTVKWFNEAKGYGFIQRPGGEDV